MQNINQICSVFVWSLFSFQANMTPSFSLLSKIPTKPVKQPVFGPKHFVVGTCDFFTSSSSPNNNKTKTDVDSNYSPKAGASKKNPSDLLPSPRGPGDAMGDVVYQGMYSSDDDTSTLSDEGSHSLMSTISGEFHDPDLLVNYSEDLDFLAEKLLLQEDDHQNLVKQLQGLKEMLNESPHKPDFLEDVVRSFGGKRRASKEVVGKLLVMESDLNSFSSRLAALSRAVLTAQTQVALSATEVNTFKSSMAFKSERINALGLLNYGAVAKRMVSEINDAHIYCNLLSLWSQDLIKFNHSLCYETSNLESKVAEYQTKLRNIKTSLCSQRDF
eukprot:TRINITY_DN3667_c0_g1_i2.p1 TRINITY_DN3667_c0_g1~~TRINITY_DN3667_c0_g1_i2.p1  ORF type:complete len:329 (-),score=37.85 TRINITY_DN3667_c0_g1_i2:2457-3443(-)